MFPLERVYSKGNSKRIKIYIYIDAARRPLLDNASLAASLTLKRILKQTLKRTSKLLRATKLLETSASKPLRKRCFVTKEPLAKNNKRKLAYSGLAVGLA